MNTKKVVIIGSGINGLVAANYLSKEGFSVSIIEKNNHTGGACTFKSKTIENHMRMLVHREKTKSVSKFEDSQTYTVSSALNITVL